MLATMALLRYCSGPAMVLPLLPRRGHIGAGPLERVFPTVDDLPRPEEDPRTGRGVAELVEVKVRDLTPALHRLGQPAQEDAVAAGSRHAPASPSHPEHKGELGGRPVKGKGGVRDNVMFLGDDRRAVLQFVNHRAA